MNGAEALLTALAECGVEVCFANPGTTEIYSVAALDSVERMRGVLTLFEGVAAGAADGYARIADRPAAVLLHLGPGFGNAVANLHNAKRAGVPVVVLVGDHATYHKHYDTPLESDIDALARTVSGWVRRSADPQRVGADVVAAVAAATRPIELVRPGQSPGRVATLIVPADVSWCEGVQPAAPSEILLAEHSAASADEAVTVAAKALKSGSSTVLLIGADATRERGLRAAARIAAATGAKLLCETFPTRLERGAGLPPVERLSYVAEAAVAQLDGAGYLILAGARSPVSFFAYPGKPSDLAPSGCQVHTLAGHTAAATPALEALAELIAPDTEPVTAPASRPAPPSGPLTGQSIAAAIGALLPEDTIVVDESNTSGLMLSAATAGAPRHDWLSLTGGAIGYGLPAAVGAAIAAPHRPVLCLQADGSAMYTVSALWTQARENLDITTVIYNNGAYDILRMEMLRALEGSAAGPKAAALLDLTKPSLDFVAIATGMGVPARRAGTAEEFTAALTAALAEPGPHLIDAVIPPLI